MFFILKCIYISKYLWNYFENAVSNVIWDFSEHQTNSIFNWKKIIWVILANHLSLQNFKKIMKTILRRVHSCKYFAIVSDILLFF